MDGIPLKGEFAKNALTLSLGTVVAQAFPMFLYPILGRIFTPAQFGVLATLASITSILTVLASGSYENSILIASTKKNAANIVGLVLILSTSFLLVSAILLQVFSNQLGTWFNEPTLQKWLFVCPISALAIIIYNCYNEWCVRNKYFVGLAFNKIINAAATTFGKLLLGVIKIVSNGLVIGDLIGRITSAGGCVFRALQKDKIEFQQISFKRMRGLAKRYVEFPKLYLPAQLLNTIGGSLPVLLIGAYFNSIEVGYYAMTMNILSVPMSVISLSIKDTFRQRANEEYSNTGSCARIFNRLLGILVFWVIMGSILLFFALPFIFSIVLGKQWLTAGVYSQILLPMIAINFISTSLSGVLIITEKMNTVLFLETYYAGTTVISLLLGCIFFHDIKTSLICFTIGRSSAYLLYIFLAYRHSKGMKVNG
jgi:O-antigen/teichoic acid export membrane protein